MKTLNRPSNLLQFVALLLTISLIQQNEMRKAFQFESFKTERAREKSRDIRPEKQSPDEIAGAVVAQLFIKPAFKARVQSVFSLRGHIVKEIAVEVEYSGGIVRELLLSPNEDMEQKLAPVLAPTLRSGHYSITLSSHSSGGLPESWISTLLYSDAFGVWHKVIFTVDRTAQLMSEIHVEQP